MNAVAEHEQDNNDSSRRPPVVVGSYNVVGDHNTVIFPGGQADWNETQARILRALPNLSDHQLARIEALVRQSFDTPGSSK